MTERATWGASNEDERREKVLDFYFEMFKYLTTLDTASAAVVIALYRAVALGPLVTGLALVCFGASLFFIWLGVIEVRDSVEHFERRKNVFPPRGWLNAAALSFVSGLVTFVVLTLSSVLGNF